MPLTFNPASLRIGIVGLGYVGLPRAVEFARTYPKYPMVGFDVKPSRIDELRRGVDNTRKSSSPAGAATTTWVFTSPRRG